MVTLITHAADIGNIIVKGKYQSISVEGMKGWSMQALYMAPITLYTFLGTVEMLERITQKASALF